MQQMIFNYYKKMNFLLKKKQFCDLNFLCLLHITFKLYQYLNATNISNEIVSKWKYHRLYSLTFPIYQ